MGLDDRPRGQQNRLGGATALALLSRSPVATGVGPDLPATPLPEGLVIDVAPPADLREKLAEIEKYALCGGRAEFTWPSGTAAPWSGKRITTFCAEPLCIETGSCTGPRFVPHLDQLTHDPEDPRAKRRWKPLDELTQREFNQRMSEALAAAKESSRRKIGREDPRPNKEIARHIGRTWDRMWKAFGSRGHWRV